MGREIKRISLNFDWPLNQIWKGYINPYYAMECKSCEGSGLNPETKKLYDEWYNKDWCHNLDQEDMQALLDAGRLKDFTDYNHIPTSEEVNEWSKKGFSHDAINRSICIEAKAKKLGFYGFCKYCKGSGLIWHSDKIEKLHDEWKGYDPPKGKGYQLWETVSEGSPVSPVFDTPEKLAKWLADNPNGLYYHDYETWLKFIKGPGWCMSGMLKNGKYYDGVTAITKKLSPVHDQKKNDVGK